MGPVWGKLSPMGSIGRYVFRTTMGAFTITLVTLTVVMWFTQAIREFDLITSQRQTLLVFVGITGLLIPLLVMMIAPISLVLATAHILNKLSSDSEIIVMNAAGISPWRLLRPLLAAGLVVSMLVAAIAVYVSPWSLRELRDWATQVRADILTNIVQPGRAGKSKRICHKSEWEISGRIRRKFKLKPGDGGIDCPLYLHAVADIEGGAALRRHQSQAVRRSLMRNHRIAAAGNKAQCSPKPFHNLFGPSPLAIQPSPTSFLNLLSISVILTHVIAVRS